MFLVLYSLCCNGLLLAHEGNKFTFHKLSLTAQKVIPLLKTPFKITTNQNK